MRRTDIDTLLEENDAEEYCVEDMMIDTPPMIVANADLMEMQRIVEELEADDLFEDVYHAARYHYAQWCNDSDTGSLAFWFAEHSVSRTAYLDLRTKVIERCQNEINEHMKYFEETSRI